MITDNREYYTVEEVAKILKLKRSHTYKLVKEGVIKAERFGRFLRVPASGIPGFMKKGGA